MNVIADSLITAIKVISQIDQEKEKTQFSASGKLEIIAQQKS